MPAQRRATPRLCSGPWPERATGTGAAVATRRRIVASCAVRTVEARAIWRRRIWDVSASTCRCVVSVAGRARQAASRALNRRRSRFVESTCVCRSCTETSADTIVPSRDRRLTAAWTRVTGTRSTRLAAPVFAPVSTFAVVRWPPSEFAIASAALEAVDTARGLDTRRSSEAE